MKPIQKKRGILGLVLSSILLLGVFLGFQLGLSSVPAAGPYYLDIPFGTASYYVGKLDNGNTYMINGDTWQQTWDSSNASAIFNACFGNLSALNPYDRGTVFAVQNNYTISASIIMPSFTKLKGEGWGTVLWAEDGLDAPVIVNDDQDTHGTVECWIEDISIHGNREGQTTFDGVHGIEWITDGCDSYWNDNYKKADHALHLRNVEVVYCKNSSIWISSSGATGYFFHDWDGFKLRFSYKYGVYQNIVSDSIFRNGWVSSSGSVAGEGAWHIEYGSTCSYDNIYFAGGTNNLYLIGGHKFSFDGCRFDHSTQHNIHLLGSARYHSITSSHITDTDYVTGNTYAGVFLDGTAHDNTIDGNTFESGNPDYCVEEGASVDNNTVTDNSFVTFGTSGCLIQGANTEVTNNFGFVTANSGALVTCYNGSWVPHGLAGDPGTTGSITLSLRGAIQYNATFILRVPTVLSSNSTHFQIEFNAWETAGWTQVPVTVVEAQTVYWDAVYKP